MFILNIDLYMEEKDIKHVSLYGGGDVFSPHIGCRCQVLEKKSRLPKVVGVAQ